VWAGLAVGSLMAGLSQLAPAIGDQPSTAAGCRIAVNGVSPERASCASCHQQNGAGQPDVGIPRLAGLSSSYIAVQLEYFATGARKDPVMAPYAAMLTPVQRQAVADYFASLPVPQQPDLIQTRQATLDRGRTLFLDGDYHTGLLSCSQCHGRTGLGVSDFSPRLEGQSADYVSQQLQQWLAGDLRDPKGNFMRAEASHLNQSDINALAAFVASMGLERPTTGENERERARTSQNGSAIAEEPVLGLEVSVGGKLTGLLGDTFSLNCSRRSRSLPLVPARFTPGKP
jgi:cytochrome c553